MKFTQKLKGYFVKDDAGKGVFQTKKFGIVLGSLCFVGAAISMVMSSGPDTSVVESSMTPIKRGSEEDGQSEEQNTETSKKVKHLFESSAQNESNKIQGIDRSQRARFVKNIEYKAPQVIKRKGPDGFERGLPIGTNLIGKLLTAIDTRETGQLYKVLLPYGGKDKNGGSLPKNSIAFGTINYPGRGKKVFIQFNKALLPSGKEVQLKAQALNSKNYSPGLVGDFNGKATERIVSTLGLTMVSAMTDTLTEREALGASPGNGGMIATDTTPKATTKNALYQGISKVSEMEAQRQARALESQPEYVTIPAGTEMIINLVSTYYGEK